ncbi:MAG: alpha/beta-type small acid-soluble spore protein [Eubacteriaceae bacterium]|nr:alpha/beta-type small acid-soluble spore protein [Eubacteriaceae bacterium]
MSKNDSKRTLQPLKNEIAQELNVDLSNGPNLTTAQVGHVGGQMVKRMVDSYESNMKNNTNTSMSG